MPKDTTHDQGEPGSGDVDQRLLREGRRRALETERRSLWELAKGTWREAPILGTPEDVLEDVGSGAFLLYGSVRGT